MPNPKLRTEVAQQFESPLLQRVATELRLNALFRATSSDFLLREQLVTDPAQILSEYIRGHALPAATASITNHLIYAVFANEQLRYWLVRYGGVHQAEPPPRDRFLQDFSQAVARAGDHSIVSGLIRTTVENEGGAGFEAFEWMVLSLGGLLKERMSDPTGGPPTGGPPTGGPPTGGPPTGGPPTGGPPTGGPPTGGPPTGGPPTGGSAFSRLPDYILVAINELVQYSVLLRERGALGIGGMRSLPQL
jgi:hypothetical protein